MGPDEFIPPRVTSVSFDEMSGTIDVTMQADNVEAARPFLRAMDTDGDAISNYMQYARWPEATLVPNDSIGISFDLVGMVRRMSNEEKRELLKLLLDAYDDLIPEKTEATKKILKINRFKELLSGRKKSTS